VGQLHPPVAAFGLSQPSLSATCVGAVDDDVTAGGTKAVAFDIWSKRRPDVARWPRGSAAVNMLTDLVAFAALAQNITSNAPVKHASDGAAVRYEGCSTVTLCFCWFA